MRSKNHIRIGVAAVLIFFCVATSGQSLRTISTAEGLSNNAIFSLYQDHIGHIWVGTSDGLNIWNGHALEMYDLKDGKNFFAGNTIRDILPDGNSGIWLRCYYGIAHIDVTTRGIEYYDSLSYAPVMACSNDGSLYVISSDKGLYYLDRNNGDFTKSDLKFLQDNEEPKRMHCFGKDSLYCFTDRGIHLIKATHVKTGEVKFELENTIRTDLQYASATPEGDICHFVSERTKDIYTFNMRTGAISLYASIGKELPKDEKFRALLPRNDDLYIGLSVSGVYLLDEGKTLIPTPIGTGIFALIHDNRQDIIWAGTDGSGVMNWHTTNLSFEEIPYSKLPVKVNMPTRSILLDKEGRLWCGTKGDGMFTISGFSPYMPLNEHNVKKFTTKNSSLTNNNVYSITESRNGKGIWIGSDGPGINWYSYSEDKIRCVPGSQNIDKVHVVYEQDENTLWIGTHATGTFRCTVTGMKHGKPSITRTEKFRFPAPFTENEKIFSIHAPDDSTIWFGSRGSGAAKLNTRSGKAETHRFPTDKGYASNDIFGIVSTDKVYFASGCGLITHDPSSEACEITDIIPNRATHSILSDNNGNLWISTNYGIVSINERSRRTVLHNQHSGLNILEYSDGAGYCDNESGTLFFGGINGITIIRNNGKPNRDDSLYTPAIDFTYHISNNIRTQLSGSLTLPHNDASFGIQFSVVDNIHYPDYEFSYRIVGLDSNWKNNGNNDIIHLSALPPGKYTLEVRYHNNSNSYTSHPASLSIRIMPPMYATWWAKALYILLISSITFYYIWRFRKKYRRLKNELRMSREMNETDQLFLARMIRIIEENMDNPELSVPFIADKLCVSSRVLHRKFEKTPHLKPQKLIKDVKMKAAAELLKSSKLSVEKIMCKTGYDNKSTFYKNFRECYGLTPKEYREQETTIQRTENK